MIDVSYHVECDGWDGEEPCEAHFTHSGELGRVADDTLLREAQMRGWRFTIEGRAWCPKHLP